MTFTECISQLEDPRRSQGLRTNLDQILIMVVVSYLCGHTGYRGVERFCKINSEFFIHSLGLRHGIPSHVTIREVLQRLDELALIKAFGQWTKNYVPLKKGDWISVDGKVLGATVKDTQKSSQDFEGVVSLFCQRSGLVHSIEHYKRKSKEKGEAPLARYLMSQLKARGLVFTIDALNTQKNNSRYS